MLTTPIISIVDDDDAVRLSMDSLVRSMGYISNAFACAEDFLASASLAITSCLISDIHMPGISGLQLVEELRTRAMGYPVIFVTASIGDLPELRAQKLGAAGYFKKPVNGVELMTRVQQLVDAT